MPQLDGLIIQSQVNFFLFFFLGYFFFLKYILPLISFFFKLKHKLIISNLVWFMYQNRLYLAEMRILRVIDS